MNIETLREYCLFKKGAEESFPFGNETMVFKVLGKVFLLSAIEAKPIQFNAKCDPEKAIELREKYPCIIPGYHMNKQHWNTVICDGSINEKMIKSLIDDSYNLIVESLSKKLRDQLQTL